MSRRKSDDPLIKVTMNFEEKSFEFMKNEYASVGATVAIRELVKAHARDRQAKRARMVESLVGEVELED